MSTPASSGPTITPTWRTVIASAFAAGTPAGPTTAGITALRVGWLTAANPETNAVSTQSSDQVAAAGQQRLHRQQRAGHRRTRPT